MTGTERKVFQKYYPPDFDPSKLPRAKQPKNRQWVQRVMTPYNMRCNTCNEYIYKGKKFNMKREPADEFYLGIRIWRFYFKCPNCLAEISFKTDVDNCDYQAESGATRLFEPFKLWKDSEKAKEMKEEEDAKDPMKMLEKRTKMSRAEMEAMGKLEEIQELNRRHEGVDVDRYLESNDTRLTIAELIRRQEAEDEALIREMYGKTAEGRVERRIKDEEDDEGAELKDAEWGGEVKDEEEDIKPDLNDIKPGPSRDSKSSESEILKRVSQSESQKRAAQPKEKFSKLISLKKAKPNSPEMKKTPGTPHPMKTKLNFNESDDEEEEEDEEDDESDEVETAAKFPVKGTPAKKVVAPVKAAEEEESDEEPPRKKSKKIIKKETTLEDVYTLEPLSNDPASIFAKCDLRAALKTTDVGKSVLDVLCAGNAVEVIPHLREHIVRVMGRLLVTNCRVKDCPTANECRLFARSVLRPWPHVDTDVFVGNRNSFLRAFVHNRKRKLARRGVIKMRRYSRESLKACELSQSEMKEMNKEISKASFPLNSVTLNLIVMTRSYRTQFMKKHTISEIFKHIPIIAVHPKMVVDDFLSTQSDDTRFKAFPSQWSTEFVDLIEAYAEKVLAREKLEHLKVLHKGTHHIPLAFLVEILDTMRGPKMLNSRGPHRLQYLLAAYPGESSIRHVLEGRKKSGLTQPGIVQIGDDVGFYIVVEGRDIYIREPIGSVLTYFVAIVHQFNTKYPKHIRDVLDILESLMGLKEIESPITRTVYRKIFP